MGVCGNPVCLEPKFFASLAQVREGKGGHRATPQPSPSPVEAVQDHPEPERNPMRDFARFTKKQLRRFIRTWECGWRDAQAEYQRRYGKPYNG